MVKMARKVAKTKMESYGTVQTKKQVAKKISTSWKKNLKIKKNLLRKSSDF